MVFTLKCQKCGKLVEYYGYFDQTLRDSWEEKGDLKCDCIEHSVDSINLPEEPAWEAIKIDNPIADAITMHQNFGVKYRLIQLPHHKAEW